MERSAGGDVVHAGGAPLVPAAMVQRPWGRGYSSPSGNRAFDEWREAELARLEEERRKLEDAHREFAEFVENIRKAKDREEFERFMNERRNRPAAG